jgi:hypothetical protein
MEAVRLVRRELAPERAVLGFAGAPFTLAAYLVEGRGTRDFVKTKALMHGAPDVWHALMTRLSDVVVAFLRGNAMAGADALQLFDSWVGALSATDYATHVRPHVQRIFAELRDLGLPSSTSARTRRTCSTWSRTRGARSSGSTGACRSTWRGRASATTSACRGTWTRPRCSPLGRGGGGDARRAESRGGPPRARLQSGPRAASRDAARRHRARGGDGAGLPHRRGPPAAV